MTSSHTPRIGIVFGTRPEVIKLYPLLAELKPHVEAGDVVVRTFNTGQQRELVAQALALFGHTPDYDFDLMQDGEPLTYAHARMTRSLGMAFADERLDRVIVQGDTLTAFTAAMCAFYARIPVAHVEAGLRTWDLGQPFPEEAHRRWITACADLHFCPTGTTRRNLIDEGVPPREAPLVGNTVIDAMRLVQDQIKPPEGLAEPIGRRLFVTVHRRENHKRLESDILPALRQVLADTPDLDAVLTVHPNPNVAEPLRRVLGSHPRIQLLDPVDYPHSLGLIRQSTLVITDSGGLQEEATALGTPVMVVRELTERIEALATGNALIIGTGAAAVASRVSKLLANPIQLERMSRPSDVFGDGYASGRIVKRIVDDLQARRPA
ncbi:MAG: UDP-N-acetylglucosamine 2-epimerase (non-hydrolyzing) [Myxococcota bacterium]|jgi:UDP-N-acetylglucosamine 2-epimerase (non-hydrolysing)